MLITKYKKTIVLLLIIPKLLKIPQQLILWQFQIQRVNAGARSPRALALDENYLYWADSYHSNVLKSDIRTGSYAGQLSGYIFGMQDIHVFKNVTLPEGNFVILQLLIIFFCIMS